jgi:hypothetical protein
MRPTLPKGCRNQLSQIAAGAKSAKQSPGPTLPNCRHETKRLEDVDSAELILGTSQIKKNTDKLTL